MEYGTKLKVEKIENVNTLYKISINVKVAPLVFRKSLTKLNYQLVSTFLQVDCVKIHFIELSQGYLKLIV